MKYKKASTPHAASITCSIISSVKGGVFISYCSTIPRIANARRHRAFYKHLTLWRPPGSYICTDPPIALSVESGSDKDPPIPSANQNLDPFAGEPVAHSTMNHPTHSSLDYHRISVIGSKPAFALRPFKAASTRERRASARAEQPATTRPIEHRDSMIDDV